MEEGEEQKKADASDESGADSRRGQRIDYTGPLFIFACITAFISDVCFLGLLALPIPVIGLVIAAGVLLFHYIAGIVVFWMLLRAGMHHLIPKIVYIVYIFLPLPFLTWGILIVSLLQSRIVEAIVEQVAVLAAAALTAPAGGAGGVAAEGAVLSAEGAGAAAAEGAAAARATAAARAAATATRAEEGVATGERVLREGEKTFAEKAREWAQDKAIGKARERFEGSDEEGYIPPEALGEERPPIERLGKTLFEEFPEREREERKQRENVEVDDDKNEVNLKKAA